MQSTDTSAKAATNHYDVVIVGAGVTGTALAYVLARYSNIKSLALVEKYSGVAAVNSKSSNNSQTLHVGEIETNYSLDKAKSVSKNVNLLLRYGQHLPAKKRNQILFKTHKMILAVGQAQIAELDARFKEFGKFFPYMKRLDREAIAKVEPAVVKGRDPKQPILAYGTDTGTAVNFGKLAKSFLDEAKQAKDCQVDAFFDTEVGKIKQIDGDWLIQTKRGDFTAKAVVVAAGSTSLLFAKMLGYGKNMSVVPIGCSFYFAPHALRGKVYTMQSPKLPFAAVHGDPDIAATGKTRFGPTAKLTPVLESRKYSTTGQYLRSAGIDYALLAYVTKLLFDKDVSLYLIKNVLYDLPYFGKRLFLKEVQKIVPAMTTKDLTFAKGFGGMRHQIIDKPTRKMILGEGQIVGDKILFNMTPSPGASTCLANAYRDAKTLVDFLQAKFETKKFEKDFL